MKLSFHTILKYHLISYDNLCWVFYIPLTKYKIQCKAVQHLLIFWVHFSFLPWAHINDYDNRPALMLDERSPYDILPLRTVCCGSQSSVWNLLPYLLLSQSPPRPFVSWFGFIKLHRKVPEDSYTFLSCWKECLDKPCYYALQLIATIKCQPFSAV